MRQSARPFERKTSRLIQNIHAARTSYPHIFSISAFLFIYMGITALIASPRGGRFASGATSQTSPASARTKTRSRAPTPAGFRSGGEPSCDGKHTGVPYVMEPRNGRPAIKTVGNFACYLLYRDCGLCLSSYSTTERNAVRKSDRNTIVFVIKTVEGKERKKALGVLAVCVIGLKQPSFNGV